LFKEALSSVISCYLVFDNGCAALPANDMRPLQVTLAQAFKIVGALLQVRRVQLEVEIEPRLVQNSEVSVKAWHIPAFKVFRSIRYA
jgi:hypothetical protein